MARKKVTIRGVDEEAWDLMKQIQATEQRYLASITNDMIYDYWDAHYGDE